MIDSLYIDKLPFRYIEIDPGSQQDVYKRQAVEKCLPIQVVTKANHTPKYFETFGKIIFPNFIFEVVKKRISVY